jgi:hypothetical protein
MNKIFENLQIIKDQLFDASDEVKQSFNSIIEYFSYGKGNIDLYGRPQSPGKYGKMYRSDSYNSDSYESSDPKMESFFAMETQFLRLSEPQMYSLFAAIQNGEYTPSNVSKTAVLMALQAAAEGANTHRLVDRIEGTSGGNYWPDWLVGSGKGYSGKREIPNLRQEYKNSKFTLEPDWHKFLNNPPYDMMATDYPKDYGGKGYKSNSYGSQSY